MSVLYIILGFVLLVLGGELLVRSSVGLSLKLNLSRMIIGLTVVSFATSAPELIVSIQSALNGLSGLAVGNVIGSNIANIGIVLGATALVAPLVMDKDFFKFNWLWMVVFSLICFGVLWTENNITRLEGILLVGLLIVFLVLLIRRARRQPAAVDIDLDVDLDEPDKQNKWWKIILFLVLGGAALWLGSEWLVKGAVQIATAFEIPESVIAVSMIAIGTSVPELAASLIAALKKEKAISLGNLVGSNIFNIGSVLGITALIQPIELQGENLSLLTNDIFWMIGFAVILLPLAFIPKRYVIFRLKGIGLLAIYGLFIYYIFSAL
ncbi:cation:H+ antiporter [Nonlabens sp. Hel1_33_55]|uniref:calcium/sodium antiporter n=1 Tax=Nonlabens sp. Hel1_33_55 TaxID=1336802 RepID=UPI000875C948|nr:calcium/sodium antiporter [Nonlabens sp. Hel1_33_55]SCY14743.1 cation:H+ antiporter [Nonlabens sp. Hel1_33_55]